MGVSAERLEQCIRDSVDAVWINISCRLELTPSDFFKSVYREWQLSFSEYMLENDYNPEPSSWPGWATRIAKQVQEALEMSPYAWSRALVNEATWHLEDPLPNETFLNWLSRLQEPSNTFRVVFNNEEIIFFKSKQDFFLAITHLMALYALRLPTGQLPSRVTCFGIGLGHDNGVHEWCKRFRTTILDSGLDLGLDLGPGLENDWGLQAVLEEHHRYEVMSRINSIAN